MRFVASDPEAYDRFYNIFANPILWFIQHYLWDLSNAPDIRRHEVEAFEFGYNVVNEDLAEAVLEEIDGTEEPVVMVHDYQLYTLPAMVRRARPDAFLHHFVHIPWTQPDAWLVLPTKMRTEIFDGLLANDIVGFHTRSYRRNFLQCCRDLMDLEVDMDRGVVQCDGREVWVRSYPLPIDWRATQGVAERDGVAEFEDAICSPGGASSRSSGSTAPTCPRTSCAASRASTSSSSSIRSSSSGSRSPRSSCRRGRTCPSTPSTWSGSRRSSRSSTTATGRRTGCRST